MHKYQFDMICPLVLWFQSFERSNYWLFNQWQLYFFPACMWYWIKYWTLEYYPFLSASQLFTPPAMFVFVSNSLVFHWCAVSNRENMLSAFLIFFLFVVCLSNFFVVLVIENWLISVFLFCYSSLLGLLLILLENMMSFEWK